MESVKEKNLAADIFRLSNIMFDTYNIQGRNGSKPYTIVCIFHDNSDSDFSLDKMDFLWIHNLIDFSFSHSVFKRLLLTKIHTHQGLFGKGLPPFFPQRGSFIEVGWFPTTTCHCSREIFEKKVE